MKSDEVIGIPTKEAFQGMVRIFNLSIGQIKVDKALRIKLIQEEAQEFIEAVKVRDIVEAIDALCDLLYVTYGAADVFKLYLETREASKTLVDMTGPKWDLLGQEIQEDFFNYSINGVVKAILGETLDIINDELQDLAEGCWECGARALGVDLRPFFREVHRTNMHKLKGPIREDGKQLKPEGWKPPRLGAMYERCLEGKNPICEVLSTLEASTLHPFDPGNISPHEGGGYCCKLCGGLFVIDE